MMACEYSVENSICIGKSSVRDRILKQNSLLMFIVFSLFLIILGNSYKFQAGNRMNAMLWFKHLTAACQSNKQQVSIY